MELGEPLVFASSPAWENRGEDTSEAIVEALYRHVLKRPPDTVGRQHYAEQLRSCATCGKEIVRDLMHSDEWAARFIEGRTIQEIVLALYDCALARAPDVEGWNQLTSWEPRDGWASVIDRMLDCPEYDTRFGADGLPGATDAAASVSLGAELSQAAAPLVQPTVLACG